MFADDSGFFEQFVIDSQICCHGAPPSHKYLHIKLCKSSGPSAKDAEAHDFQPPSFILSSLVGFPKTSISPSCPPVFFC
jgi:hypothetical protein